jgi:hypothetical protein
MFVFLLPCASLPLCSLPSFLPACPMQPSSLPVFLPACPRAAFLPSCLPALMQPAYSPACPMQPVYVSRLMHVSYNYHPCVLINMDVVNCTLYISSSTGTTNKVGYTIKSRYALVSPTRLISYFIYEFHKFPSRNRNFFFCWSRSVKKDDLRKLASSWIKNGIANPVPQEVWSGSILGYWGIKNQNWFDR